jgi:type I restriction enzyme S subunit
VLPLAEVAHFQEGPGILAKDFREEGIPLLRLKCVEGDYVTLDGCNYLCPDMVSRKWSHFRVEPGDLLISTSASLGRVSVVTEQAAGGVPYTGLIRFKSKDPRLLQDYLKVFLGSAAFVEQAEAMATGSVIRHFGPSHIRQMAIILPPLVQQREIGGMASVLDQRLRQLRQTNATLESIAQTLFKSWFIDFDPVRAKAEGREPEGMDAATAALFPAQFEESTLGLIPKGWTVRSVDSFATYLNGLALQKYPPESDDEFLPVIKIAQLRAGHTNGADRASARLKPEYVVHDGDVLFSWSGSLEVEFWCGGDGALNQHLFKVTSNEVPKWLYYLATKHFLPSFREIAAHKATTMGHIQRKHLTESRIALPPVTLLQALSPLVATLLERRIVGALQARHLAAVRESLLPRLISGKLRLPEAQEQVEEALA